VDNRVSNLNCNWEDCIRKIGGLINYWSRYNLTVTGRVMVTNTFLMSQVTFLLGIIPVEKGTLDRIDKQLAKYACGTLQIAADRIYNRVEQGGLGIISMCEMNTAIKSAWINRWRREGTGRDITAIRVMGNQLRPDIEKIGLEGVYEKRSPVAWSIRGCWLEFMGKFYENEGRLVKAKLFFNPVIKDRLGLVLTGTSIFSVRNLENVREQLDSIQVEDLYLNGTVKSKEEIEEGLNVILTAVEYNRIRMVIAGLIKRFKPVVEMEEKAETIGEILGKVFKGNRKLRNIISGSGSIK